MPPTLDYQGFLHRVSLTGIPRIVDRTDATVPFNSNQMFVVLQPIENLGPKIP